MAYADGGSRLIGIPYDPYDYEIDADPYPIWKRMRDEAPLYDNHTYDFYAVTAVRRRARHVGRLAREAADLV